MASIELGPLITDIHGSIGGTTFSKNPSGRIARTRSVGKRSLTIKQSISLHQNIAITNIWTGLNNTLKEDWNTFASLYTFSDRYGKVKTLSGFNWFVMINSNYFYVTGLYTVAPFTYLVPFSLPSFNVILTTTDMSILFSTPINQLTTEILVFTSIPTTSNAKYNRSQYRLTTVLPPVHDSLFSFKDAWESTHKLPWTSLNYNGNFNISVLIVPISLTSYMTGLGQTNSGIITTSGIGLMDIGGTFVVS